MNFEIPADITAFLGELDQFIDDKIKPLENADDNVRFFDYRREDARTDWERDGLPNKEWEALLRKAKDLAIEAGIFNYPFPAEFGGRDGGNLGMALIREHLAAKGLGLHNDLQNEHSIVGNNIGLLLMLKYGSAQQKDQWLGGLATASQGFAFGITEPEHGSDATYMETSARRDGDDWIISGEKTWNTGVHTADADMVMARTSGKPGDALGITAFLVPMQAPGVKIEEYLWTFNMPSDHARVSFTDVRVPHDTIFDNRIRQAASSLGAAQYCVTEAVAHAKARKPFGKALATNQAIQFPLVDLNTRCEMLRALIHKTAWLMDRDGAFSVSDKVSMCNYQANRLCCEAADFAMQVHGGMGYSRYKPFEHIYRHHRRYRITEGADEIQIRRAAGYLFGFMNQKQPKGVQGES
ncbi:MAG: acyl-CoA dehydrogenase family protein [Congregibacter sp.]|nr:acyl-CoA dehydrogenase family protein [Congregibacter sp.]